MKIFINLELSAKADEEKEKTLIETFERLEIEIRKFCSVSKSRLHYINYAICETIYNSILHGGTSDSLKIETGLIRYDKKLVFFIKDNGNFYRKKEIRKAIKEKDLKKLRNFKPHEKSKGNGFEIIFESKPKTRTHKGIFYLVWEKARD